MDLDDSDMDPNFQSPRKMSTSSSSLLSDDNNDELKKTAAAPTEKVPEEKTSGDVVNRFDVHQTKRPAAELTETSGEHSGARRVCSIKDCGEIFENYVLNKTAIIKHIQAEYISMNVDKLEK